VGLSSTPVIVPAVPPVCQQLDINSGAGAADDGYDLRYISPGLAVGVTNGWLGRGVLFVAAAAGRRLRRVVRWLRSGTPSASSTTAAWRPLSTIPTTTRLGALAPRALILITSLVLASRQRRCVLAGLGFCDRRFLFPVGHQPCQPCQHSHQDDDYQSDHHQLYRHDRHMFLYRSRRTPAALLPRLGCVPRALAARVLKLRLCRAPSLSRPRSRVIGVADMSSA